MKYTVTNNSHSTKAIKGVNAWLPTVEPGESETLDFNPSEADIAFYASHGVVIKPVKAATTKKASKKVA